MNDFALHGTHELQTNVKQGAKQSVMEVGMSRPISEKEASSLAVSQDVLRFAVESGKNVPDKTVSGITAALGAKETDAWDDQIATNFWLSFNSLCVLIAPATVDSLQTGLNPDLPARDDIAKWRFWARKPMTRPRRTAHHYMLLLMLLLFVNVLLGFILSTATRLSEDVQGRINALNKAAGEIESSTASLEAQIGQQPFNVAPKEHGDKILSLLHQIREANHISSELMEKFDILSQKLLFFRIRDPWHHSGHLSDHHTETTPIAREFVGSYYDINEQAASGLIKASLIINSLTSILPILLGFMGACAYIVRLISDQIRDTTFTRTSPIRHQVRLALGGLAGIVVGFSGIVTETTLSASALAFIAGYAVEPVFAAIDSIAEKFTR